MASASWKCHRCTMANGASLLECDVCKLPRNVVTEPCEWWQCGHCCQFNAVGTMECSACDRPPPPSSLASQNVQSPSASAVAGEEPGGCRGRHLPKPTTERKDNSVPELTTERTERTDNSVPELTTEKTDNSEATEETETAWVCQAQSGSDACGSLNSFDTYRCQHCGVIKPYLPHQLSLSQVPRGSLGCGSIRGGGDGETQRQTGKSQSWGEGEGRESSREGEGKESLKKGEENENLREGEGREKSREGEENCWESSGDEGSGRSQEEATQQFFHRWTMRKALGEATQQECGEGAEAAGSLQRLDLDDAMACDEEVVDFPDSECRLVLVGKTGNGKSATANTILGLDGRFEASFQFGSQTTKCQRHNALRFGVRVEVVDTPGLFDTHMDQETVTTEVTKCLGIVSPGPHAILLVLRIGVRFTEEERKAVEEVHRMFGVQLLRFLVIVFTHGDELKDLSPDEREETLKGMLQNAPKSLQDVLSKANHRYVVFNNKGTSEEKQQQVKQLLTTVCKLLKVNGNRPFTSDLLQSVERCMSDRERVLERELEGWRRHREIATSRERRHFYRDIAREEVVQEKPLLVTLKKQVLPILVKVLDILGKILIGVVLKKVGGGGGGNECVLQ